MRKKGIILVFLMAVILCGPASAMYPYTPDSYPPNTIPTTDHYVTEEEWDDLTSGGSGDALKYIGQLPSSSQQNVIKDGSDISSGESSGEASTGSSTSSDSSTGVVINNPQINTTNESGATSTEDSGKSYESDKAGTSNANDIPWVLYVVGGIGSVLAIAGVGFYFKGDLLGR